METATATHTYYIGDLCYVMHDVWDEVCELTFPEGTITSFEGQFQLADGRKFLMFDTLYGDGEYFDNLGNTYPVDSGTIGAILLDDIRDDRAHPESGAIHVMDRPLTASNCREAKGELWFGNIVIMTYLELDEEEEEEEEDIGAALNERLNLLGDAFGSLKFPEEVTPSV